MLDSPDYYSLLEVSPQATPKEIKEAFLLKAKRLHPDVNTDPQANHHMAQINEAFSILSNPSRRAEYDRLRVIAPSVNDVNDGGKSLVETIQSILNEPIVIYAIAQMLRNLQPIDRKRREDFGL